MGEVFAADFRPEPKKRFDFGGFFTSVVFQKEEPWTPAEAFLCVVTAAAAADGNISPEESEEILVSVHRIRLFKEASNDTIRQISNKVADRLAKRGDRAIADACEALPPELRLPVFAHAVDIVLADGSYVQAEAEFLNNLIRMLEVGEADARKIAEVLDIKNRC